MIVETFDDIFKVIVRNELAYINTCVDSDKLYLKQKLGVNDLDSWTVMDKVYDFVEANFDIKRDFNNVLLSNWTGEDRVMMAIEGLSAGGQRLLIGGYKKQYR